MGILLILKDALSLRAVPKAIKRCFACLPSLKNARIATHSTLSRWIKRVGLHKLTQPLEIADDWIAIIDASISIGSQKCLVILGIRRKTFSEIIKKSRALSLEDVKVLHMKLAKNINSQLVYEALKNSGKRIGYFSQTCGDGGSEVIGGVKLLQKDSKANGRVVRHMYDVAHKMACFLKAEFAEDPQWKAFISEASASKLKLQLGEWGHLCSPNQRSKSRYMNMEQLMGWGIKMLTILNDPKDPSHNDALDHFVWVKKYENMIQLVGEHLVITGEIRHKIRMEGITSKTHLELVNRYLSMPMSMRTSDFCGKILDFFESSTAGLSPEEHLLGLSEIIESLFGKLKNLIREDLKKGFTGSVLFAAACVGKIDDIVVKEAMEAITDKGVKEWVEKNIGETFVQKRRRCLGHNRKKPGRKAVQKNIRALVVPVSVAEEAMADEKVKQRIGKKIIQKWRRCLGCNRKRPRKNLGQKQAGTPVVPISVT